MYIPGIHLQEDTMNTRTPDFGTLIDFWTGELIRSATKLEWLRSTTAGSHVVIEVEGRDVQVTGGPSW
jgi:hypothetical protein